MDRFDRYIKMALATALVLAFAAVGDARTRKGDKFLAEGALAESHKDWDAALDAYEKAIAEDSADVAYQIAIKRVRFQAGQMHVDAGQKMRQAGEIDKALAEFQLGHTDEAQESATRSLAIDPRHTVPNTEQLLAVILARKGDYVGALLHLNNCLSYLPPGPHADLVKQQIAQLEPKVTPTK